MIMEGIARVTPRRLATGLWKAILAAGLIGIPLGYFGARYSLGLDGGLGAKCLPWGVYVIDTWNRDIRRGDLMAFRARGMAPFYRDGTVVVKLAAAVGGDRVSVHQGQAVVAGIFMGNLVHAGDGGRLRAMGKSAREYERDQVLAEGQIFAMGTHPRSYDSRYWGPVEHEQVIGHATALW